MFARKLKLNLVMALATSATVFYLGCGDDDDNATPSNKGGASSTGGGGGTGGKATGGGGSTSTGGKSSTGGNGNEGGGATTGGTGEGGGAPEGGVGGGTPEGGVGGGGAPQGGVGGGGAGAGGGGVLPDCEEKNASECYEECTATTNEQLLNICSDTAECTPFDNSTLSELGPNGELPTPIP